MLPQAGAGGALPGNLGRDFSDLRLIAGFNAPNSNLRLLLTAADTRDKVRRDELDRALRLARTLTWQALTVTGTTLSNLAAGRD